MSGFPTVSHGGNLIVNPGSSTPGSLQTYLRESRWWCLQMSPFTLGMPPLRSGGDDNAVIPGEVGRYAFQQVLDQGTYVTAIRVTGECGASGIAPTGTDPTRFLTQLRTNRNHLLANVHTPVGITRSARLVLPDATTVDFDAQFALTLVDQKIAMASFMLDVVVPDGVIA